MVSEGSLFNDVSCLIGSIVTTDKIVKFSKFKFLFIKSK